MASLPYHFAPAHKQEPLACGALDLLGDAHCSHGMLMHPSAGYSAGLLQPGSPQQTAETRCRGYGSLCSPMEADVRLLSGSKRSCEGYTSLKDEVEADDASMASGSHMLCRSGSARSLGIKRVCSVASADAIDSHCSPQPTGSMMIPVPGIHSSSNNLQQAAAAAHQAHALPAKRSSKTGSSSSSLEAAHTQTLATAAAGQEAASGPGRKLAPIKTAAAPPRGPRMRLNGRLLSPEEAQKHLAAVAAAAAAASSGRSLSRAQSPSVATGPDRTSGPASGPHDDSTSPSTGAPCSSAGHSSGPAGFKPAHEAAAVAGPGVLPHPAAARMGGSQVFSALEVLPENFIPTPEGAGNWFTLASTLEDGCGATSRGCSSPLVCSSYTELLLAEEGGACAGQLPPAAAAGADGSSFTAPHRGRSMGAGAPAAAAAGAGGGVSAFAAHSVAPWPIALPQQQRQQYAGRHLLVSAGSASDQTPLSSSYPVHTAVADNSSGSSWTSSKLLGGSVSGSNGSSGRGTGSLAASLAPGGDAGMTELLGAWGVPQPQQPVQLVPQPQQQAALVTLTSLGSSSGFAAPAAWGAASAPACLPSPAASAAAAPAWKPAFAPAAAGGLQAAGASTSNMMPTPGGSAVLTALPQQQQQPQQLAPQAGRTKGSSSRARKHSKAAAAAKAAGSAAPTLPLQLPAQVAATLPQQQHQQVLMVADGAQQVVLSQQELMAIVQQNMAASFASGYMMASSMQGGQQPQQQPGPGVQLQQQPPLLKPVASVGAFVMPPSAVATAQGAPSAGAGAGSMVPAGLAALPPGGSAGFDTTAAAASALGSSTDMARLVGGGGVDDILPSLQELLTDCDCC